MRVYCPLMGCTNLIAAVAMPIESLNSTFEIVKFGYPDEGGLPPVTPVILFRHKGVKKMVNFLTPILLFFLLKNSFPDQN